MVQEFFPTAIELRNRKKRSRTNHDEIMFVQNEILLADEAGLIEVSVDTSPFTLPSTEAEAYYSVWKGLTTDRLLELQMAEVLKFFVDRGYSIVRKTNLSTNNTFYWNIKW